MLFWAYAAAKVRLKIYHMTMPIPEFHPHSTSDLYLAAYGLQRSGRDGEVVEKIQKLVDMAVGDHVPVAELPLLNSDESVMVFAGLRSVLDSGDGDPEALAATEVLLEEQLDPAAVIRHDEDMRMRAEQARGQYIAVNAGAQGVRASNLLSVVPNDFFEQVRRLVEMAEREERYDDCPTGEWRVVA